jgi:hypothetical protein
VKAGQRLLVLLLTLSAIDGTTWAVVVQNQRKALYPVDADSIGIPMSSVGCRARHSSIAFVGVGRSGAFV